MFDVNSSGIVMVCIYIPVCIPSHVLYTQPPRRPVKVNKYVVPTDKKRQALRWEIRHQMAQ